MNRFWAILGVLLGLGSFAAQAADALKLPRFASLAKDEIFVRTGPSSQYPIRWVYQKRGLPVEILREYDTWRQIRDRDGGEGWVHHAMLSGARYVIITAKDGVVLRSRAKDSAGSVVQLDPGVVAAVEECTPTWCELRLSGFSGWAPRAALWGIYADEQID